jgi:eukaryotic-like serine/threonine-protein kinase
VQHKKGRDVSAPTEHESPRSGDFLAAKYRVEEVLGRGGMGTVYRVTHAVTGKHFAVKCLLPQYHAGQEVAQRFIREAQVAGRVDHPNIVEVYDIGEDRGSMYMVMELLQGESLAQHLARVQRVSASEACQLLIPVTRGLAAAHRAGIIHRDLKPDNIFLSVNPVGDTQPKILDFGISKMSALATDQNPALTREGVVMGTPNYMAPEQLRSHKVDERCDIYALGVIMYQMLSGQLPFIGDNFPDLMLKIVGDAPAPLAKLAPEAPRDLIAIIECAMSRNAVERFDSVADLGRALEPFADGVLFDVELAHSARPTSSILPGPATPVATESRFPSTVAPMANLPARARRIAVPLAISAASALMFSWVYGSIDGQPSEAAAATGALHEATADGKTETTQHAAKLRVDETALAQQASPDTLPVPKVETLADATLAEAAQAAQQIAEPAALIGGVLQPDPEPIAQLDPEAQPAAEPTPHAAKQPLTAGVAVPSGPVELPPLEAAEPRPTSAAPRIPLEAAAPRPTSPGPVPPPGAAAPGSESTKAKKSPAAKKPPPRSFVSPEMRMNDFFE